MSTQTFRRQTQIAFDVNVKVNNTDTSGNIITDDITLYYADSLIIDIAMGLFDDTVKYPALYWKPWYISITDKTDTPYSKDLQIMYSTLVYGDNIQNYINSLKDYKKYKDVIKCSPFFRATPLVYKNILGLEPTCVQESTKYSNYNTTDLLLNEKDWRNISCRLGIDLYAYYNFSKELLYNICWANSTYTIPSSSSTSSVPYRYGDGKKYYEMTSYNNGTSNNKAVYQAFGLEIAYQLRQMSDEEYAELVRVWLEKVKETCYEDVKTRVDGEYVGGLDLDFSEFVAQRPYNE